MTASCSVHSLGLSTWVFDLMKSSCWHRLSSISRLFSSTNCAVARFRHFWSAPVWLLASRQTIRPVGSHDPGITRGDPFEVPSSILAIIPNGAARVGRLKYLRLDRCFSSFATEGTEFFFSEWFWCFQVLYERVRVVWKGGVALLNRLLFW